MTVALEPDSMDPHPNVETREIVHDSDRNLVFRGTMSDSEEVADLWTDQVPYAFAPGYGQVHSGFHGIYQQLQPQVATAIAAAISSVAPLKRFFFTGHSLGSGLSSLAVGLQAPCHHADRKRRRNRSHRRSGDRCR